MVAATRVTRAGNTVLCWERLIHGAVLQGLPQLIQDRPQKFRQLIKEKHATVGQAHLPRTG